MEKTKKCKSCGKELPKDAKFCNECGAKFKKPIYTRWWFWVIAVVVFIVIVGAASEGDENPGAVRSQPSESVPVTSTPKPTETPKPTPSPTVKPTVEPTVKPSENKGVSVESLCSLIEITLSENFSGYTVIPEENAITVNVWVDGVALEMAVGGAAAEASWEIAKESMMSMFDSIRGVIDAAGRDDVHLMLNVLNDANLENTLLSIFEGTIIYDAMED